VFRDDALALFRFEGDLGDALFHRFFFGGEGSDVLADLRKVFDGVDDALLRLVVEFFVFGKFFVERGDLRAEGGTFLLRLAHFPPVFLGRTFRGGKFRGDLFQPFCAVGKEFFVAFALFAVKIDALADEIDVPLFLLKIEGVFQNFLVEALQQLVRFRDAAPVVAVFAFEVFRLLAPFGDLFVQIVQHGVNGAFRRFGGIVLVYVEIDLVLFQFVV